ncbi:unnamed protein product [Bursaphelenchus xylophilus]|uniref:(pine wood nematode) hypothetical protein n=1 Tax=Bursaphelenchus xylophilus TaxID=6326 RepID=A0A1I7RQU4_BURXY|nr:unnamed protein product [Bursaphelenchus xylophilus]CAG9130673.1 unnamed protein product [Bursaphelenchus xylophilus]
MRHQPGISELFGQQRNTLRSQIASRLVRSMTSMMSHRDTADLLLVSVDGRKLPVHLCILRQRAPVFFQRYIEPTLNATPRAATPQLPLEVAVGDVDSTGLSFFIKSIYTDEELVTLPNEMKTMEKTPRCSENEPLEEEIVMYRDGLRDEIADQIPRKNSDSLNSSRVASQSHLCDMTNQEIPPEMSASYPSPGDYKNHSIQDLLGSASNLQQQAPMMTSFKELASQQSLNTTDSPMCTSTYSDRDDDCRRRSRSVASDVQGQSCKFIRLDDSGVSSRSTSDRSETRKSIFPMFIGMGAYDTMEDPMSQSAPSAENFGSTIRGRAMMARRLSVSSLTSLTSIDLTPTHENAPIFTDNDPASQLAKDLLQIYKRGKDSDVSITTNAGDLKGHRCILSATCSEFKKALGSSSRIDLSKYSLSTVDFLLQFLYGGLTCVPENVNIWELLALADALRLDQLLQVAMLHLKAQKCHFFHRPCASCVSAVFDALPQFSELAVLRPLYEEAMAWQCKHFARIWKGRIFLHLSEYWQKECFEALIQSVTDESVIEVLLGCEKLQIALPRIKAQHSSIYVQKMVNDVVEYCTDFLISSLDLVVQSKLFIQQGKGLALNLSLLEDILPSLIHSLNADTAIKTFISLKQLLTDIAEGRIQSSSTSSVNQVEDFNPRFLLLCRRLLELCDKHLLHFTASVVKSKAWDLLEKADQDRIQETGIFVEMCLPKAPPPRLSSFNRSYKRSSSVGFGQGIQSKLDVAYYGGYERTRSLERARPASTFTQLLEADEPLEAILEREKSQTQIHLEQHRRANSMREQSSSRMSVKSNASTIKHKSPQPSEMDLTRRTEKKSSDAPKLKSPKQTLVPKLSSPESPTKRVTKSRHPPPVKRPIPAQSVNVNIERQNTQTLMTAEQNKEKGIDTSATDIKPSTSDPFRKETNNSPQSADTVKNKPRSVVKPMPKPTPSTVTQSKTVTRRSVTGATAAYAAKVVDKPKSALPRQLPPPNAAILTRASRASGVQSIDGKVKRKELETDSRIPRSPKIGRR